MKRLQRLLILLLTVVFVLPLFPASVAASGQNDQFPWDAGYRDGADYYDYDSLASYLFSYFSNSYTGGNAIPTNSGNDPADSGSPVDAGDTVPYYAEDTYSEDIYNVVVPSSDAPAAAQGADDAADAQEESESAEEKDSEAQAEQDDLTEQTIAAEQPKPTDTVLSFKERLANRLDRLSEGAPARRELPDVTITIRGRLPQGATASARYFSAAEDEQFGGYALFAYEITVYDAFGAVYRPADELTVTVSSPLIATALQDGMALTVCRYTGWDDETEEMDSESSADLCRFSTAELPARLVFSTSPASRTVFDEYLPEAGKSAGEGGSRVTVSGALPAGVTAEVQPVSNDAYEVELGQPLLAFDVTLYRDGAEYQPRSYAPVNVTVHNPRIASALADGYAVGVWHITKDGACQQMSGVSASGDAVSFTVSEFSPCVLGLAAREIDVFADAYLEASLLGIDPSAAPEWDGSAEPELSDGLELLEACEVDCAGSGMWLNVTLTDEPDLGELESLTLYGLADGELLESLSADVAGAGETAIIDLDEADGFALVKDTGLRSRSLTVNPEQDESVTISGRIPTDATVTAVTAPDAEDAVCAYDISLLNNGKEYQPGEANPVTVTIKNEAIAAAVAAGSELSLWHISDGGQREEIASFRIEGDEISFQATSFSIYSIEEAKDPPTVQDMEDLAIKFDDPNGFILSYRNSSNIDNYFTNSLNSNSAFIETTDKNAASIWYFEKVDGADNQYYVYTYINGVKQYMKNTGGNLMGLSTEAGTVFELSQAPGGKFYFKVLGQNRWLQHSNGGGGIRLYTSNSDANNSRITITFATSIEQTDDYYELDGKTCGIAFHQESVKAAGLTTLSKTVNNQSGLAPAELLVKPDVLDYSGELLVTQDSDLAEWTFEWVSENFYYLTTQIGGQTMYLTLDGRNLVLAGTPDGEKSLIKVESGAGEHKGKYRFSVGANALTLPSGNVTSGFVSSNNGGDYSWLNLVSLTDDLTEEDFVIYSAEKVDISDREMVPDGSKVVVYTRLWNEEKKKYEFYAVNHDGKLIRCYESGDMIQWVGSQFNTALWDFTEYTYDDGTPNYYYELQSDYSEKYIAPQVSDGQVLSDGTIGINLNGRRFGYYYSTILAWDDQHYAYAGLKAEDGSIVSCSLDEAEVFYFAIMKEPEPEEQLADVATVDNTQYGITMKMVDFPSRDMMSGFLGSDGGGEGVELHTGLLSNKLGDNGYPTVTANNNDLGDMYAGADEVNHLFIKNTYYSSGYFEYDSTQNFATLGDDNNFTVYSELGTARTSSTRPSMQHSQFLPYNDLSDEYSGLYNLYDANRQELPDSDPRKGEPLYVVEGETDYHFGVEIEASFTQTANGNDAWGHDIIYEFTGDDDFWLYVDGVLVIDLGGIHSAVPGSVNYRTGEVFVNGTYTTLRDVFYNNYVSRGHTAAEAQAYVNEKFEQNSDGQWVFKDYTTHTMKIFYMERGAGASNLHMRFNLASVKPGTVLLSKELDGVDESESSLAEFPYQIFYLQEEDGQREWVQITPAMVAEQGSGIRVVYQDTNRAVKSHASLTMDGVTYDSVFMLRPGEIAEIDFPEDGVYYYIKECGVDTDVYDQVTVDGETLTGEQAGPQRHDFSFGYVDPGEDPDDPDAGYLRINENPRAAFVNHVKDDARQTLTFSKLLFDETGNNPINSDDATFSFRLYLGTENDAPDDLPPAFLYKYHVKDNHGNYCRWDADESALVPIPGQTDYSTMSDAEKASVTFTTSPNGSIANIPVDYTVEVRELLPGTQYKVEERPWEVPDGYSLQKYVRKEDAGDAAGTESDDPPSGIIVTDKDPHVDIRNLKGWGLRVNKTWTDGDFMAERDPVYFAVYIEDGGELRLVQGTVRQLGFGEDTLYWYFPTLGEYDFDQYVVREVLLNSPTVGDDGTVTAYDAISYIQDGGTFQVSGRKHGDPQEESLTYMVSYEQGEMLEGANVRVDEATNSRQGVGLYKTDWNGEPLAGAVFTLTDGEGNDACGNGNELTKLTSRADGLITTAYLRPGETYTLTEIQSPAGYRALPAPLTISVNADNEVVVNGGEGWGSLNTADWYDQHPGVAGMSIANIYVKDKPFTLEMKKTDGDGDPLAGVHFALYRQVKDSHGNPRKDYDPIPGYEDLVTDEDGLVPQLTADFLAGTLKPGAYYLYEKEPPDGYLPLSGDVLFTVDEKGVLSLDPSSPDGVSVEPLDGSTLQYTVVIPNESFETVDLTVSKVVSGATTADDLGIKTFNFTARLYKPDGVHNWDYSGGDFSHGTASFVLSHNAVKTLQIPKGAVVKVTEDNPGSAYNTTHQLGVDGQPVAGYSCETGELDADQELVFTNTRKTVRVTVKKTVVGSSGNFAFTAQLKDGDVDCAGYTLAQGIVTDANGEATFNISPGASSTVSRALTVPYGSTLTISEADYPSYTTTVSGSGAVISERTATLPASATVSNREITFTNTQTSVSPTGYVGDDHMGAFQGLCLLGLALLAAVIIPAERKRRKAAADDRQQM